MAKSTITATISFTWWLRVYLAGVMFVAQVVHREPDMRRMMPKIKRAMRVTVGEV